MSGLDSRVRATAGTTGPWGRPELFLIGRPLRNELRQVGANQSSRAMQRELRRVP
jgi:hypothetical protein